MDGADHIAETYAGGVLREDWVPKEAYISREFAELERERLWRRTWQMACREEDLPETGSYVVYDILGESVIVIRDQSRNIRAFNNACQHRGRRLLEGCGRSGRMVCRFHGWTWNIDGTNARVLDRGDWRGRLDDVDLNLPEFKVGLWGGFVFVNMADDPMPFEAFTAPLKPLASLEMETWRYRWYITLEVDANWKTCQEAFQEGYHVMATHPQFHPFLDSRTYGYPAGVHGYMVSAPDDGLKSDHRPVAESGLDGREAFVEYVRQMTQTFPFYSDRDLQAAARVLDEMPKGTPYAQAAYQALQNMREAAVNSGAGFPNLDLLQASQVGSVWSLFPNATTVCSTLAGIWYIFRPFPDNNPDRCLMDLFALERMVPGAAPKITRRYYTDWRDCPDLPSFTFDDFRNLPEVQRGMHTIGFKGARMNPLQEGIIPHFHQVMASYLYGDGPAPDPVAKGA
jgi:phenylpropionate dioxygenase-like ring-hydroxylating dioxygenase large terminal subunit